MSHPTARQDYRLKLRYWCGLLLLAALQQPAQAATLNLNLPDIGDTAGSSISPADERRMGEAFMREIRRSLKIMDDPEITQYINSLGYQLAANSDNQSLDFTFFVVDDPSINAFAAPGGFIGMHSGLIMGTESEGELASVLAHEIGHLTQRHIARRIEAVNKMSLPSTAAFLAAILIGTQNSELGQAALAATQAGSVQAQINFTRGNEEEADRVGVQTLARAGFDPRSMPGFFERLQKSSRYIGASVPEFLRTHPVDESRIADTRNRAEQYPYRQVSDNLNYHLVRAKLRVLKEANPKQTVQRFAAALKSGQYRNAAAEHYGYALALLANGEYAAARTELNTLLATDKERIAYINALAQVDLADKRVPQALRAYADALQLLPGNPVLTLNYSRALLQAGQAGQAQRLLADYIRRRPPDPMLYKLLADAEIAAGQTAAAHQALAEHYYLNGQTGAAVEQLQAGIKAPDSDFYRSSQMEARLKQLQAEMAEEDKH